MTVKPIRRTIIPTAEQALMHLGIDCPDLETGLIVRHKLAAAVATLRGAVGADVDELMPNDPRVAELVYTYLDDLYSNRGVSAKVSGATRQLVQTTELQLRMELRRLRQLNEEQPDEEQPDEGASE